MSVLRLPLKKKWFDMIKSGEKLEEYRDTNYYWVARLLQNSRNPITGCFESTDGKKFIKEFKKFDKLCFTLGYPKADCTDRRLVFRNPKIRIGKGKPEWGAEPGKIYFIITWDEYHEKKGNEEK